MNHKNALTDIVSMFQWIGLYHRPTSTRNTLYQWCSQDLHCVPKNIPDIYDCNLKTYYQILIIFGTNIPDTTCHQMIIQFSTSPNVCFCTT